MTTFHNRSRLPRQEVLNTAPMVYPAEASTEVGAEEPRNDKPLLRHFMDWLREVRVTWPWLNKG